jgi:hypothetical protein
MSQSFILLDTGPLGMITNRPGNPDCQAIQQWFNASRFTTALTWQEISIE